MKKLLLTTLLIFGTAIVHGQDKMQFSIIGGYEHFKKKIHTTKLPDMV
ncbi:hypothetical protein NXW46_00775 [Bacteroides fragilis]|nr:hypothetical protein [Bacteroides fragilis]MCS3110230.1 hypothetical protein [Bacteroides fragilis]MCS3297144.1 hypothetical protein [Bacteroides fragilis]UVP90226.1 hypothetical protein NXV34_00935 [Bacteroides fragilis]UVR18351.1 hypothetical protein NXX17_00875 [Bacteroides fragilis]